MLKNLTLKYFIIALISTLLSVTAMFGQTASVDCAAGSGTALTVGTAVTVNALNTLGNPALSATNCGMTAVAASATRDVWYWFTATAASSTVTFTPSGSRDAGLIVYDACTTTVLGCSNAGTGNTLETTTFNTVVGNTYGVRLLRIGSTTSNITGSLVVTIGNNDCSGAIALTAASNTSCTGLVSGTLGATQSQAGCTGTADDDVWFSFVATATSHQVTVTPGTMLNPVFQLFSGSCGSLTSVGCIDGSTGNGVAEASNFTGLSVGTTYYVRAHSSGNGSGQGTFTICVNNIAPSNDECNNATSITAASNTTCTTTSGTTINASQSQAGCSGTADDDVWYSFAATATSHQVTVTPGTMLNPVFQLFSGSCGSLTSVTCVDASTGNTTAEVSNFTGLTVGTTYFVRVHSNGNASGQGTFTICVNNIAPSNDECNNAISITAATNSTCTTTSATTVGASQSLTGCDGIADDDVWFSFVATAVSHQVTVTPGTLQNPVFQIFSGNCGSTTQLTNGCVNQSNTNTTAESSTFSGLTVGTTYRVRVYGAGNGVGQGTFTICVTGFVPDNNDCTGAVSVTASSTNTCTAVSGTSANATQSQAACSGTADDDVWYSFVATATSHQVTVTPGTMLNPVFQLFSGSCGSLTSVTCVDASTGNTTAEVSNFTGLTIGTTYFVRVHSNGNGTGQGTFTICVNNIAPSNDECNNATSITAASNTTCTTTSGTTINATQSQAGCSGTADDDVWYSFVATATSHQVTVTPGTMLNPVFQLFSGSCGSLTSVTCVDASAGNTTAEVSNFTGLTIGTTYFVRVHSNGNGTGQGTFTICVNNIAPSNDECNNATSITAASNTTCTATSGTTINSSQSLAGCSGNADDDVWYSFLATATSHQVTVTPVTMLNPVFQLFSGTCGSLTSVGCINASAVNTTAEVSNFTGLSVGTTYFVRVYSNAGGSGQGTFTICVNNIAPSNDNCVGATSITAASNTTCTTTSGTTINATQSQAGCSGTADDDVWYSFVATATSHQVTVTPGTMLNPVFQLFSGSCGSLTSVTCVDASTGNTTAEVSNFTGLTVNTTYYVRVHSSGYASGQGTFTICVTSIAPSNDECNNATSVTAASNATCTSVSGTTLNATQSLAGCNGTADDDVWYSFVATATTHQVTVTPGTMQNPVFEVFSGSCGSLTSLGCINASAVNTTAEVSNFTGLTINTTYYVRVYSNALNAGQGTFTICVNNIAPSNNECSGAISITPTSNNTCNLTAGTTVNASQSLAGCTGNADDDVWYSFVANASSHQIRVERGATGGFNNAVFELFSGTCGSLTQYTNGCVNADPANNNAEQRNFTGLTIGSTYFVRVYSNGGGGNQGTFGICITSQAPANDDCENAITLTVNTGETCVTSTNGTTVNATQTLAGCVGTADDDVWYKFVATNTSHRVTVTRNTLSDAVLEVFSGSCGSLTSLGCTDSDLGTIEINNFHNLVVGQTYYVRVYDYWPFLTGTFSICVSVPTDPCLTIGSIASCGETTNATITGTGSWNSYPGVIWAVPGKEMLWTYTPNISGSFVVDVQTLTGGGFVDFYFRQATSCGYNGWTYIEDFNAAGVSVPFNLVAGTQYYILLDDRNYTSSTVSFILRRQDNTPCQSLVSLGNTSLSLVETGGTFNIPINVVNPSPTSGINVTLTAVSGNLSRIGGFSSAAVTIPAGATTFNYSINLTDNASCEDFQTIVFELSNISSVASAALTSPTSLSAIIEDNETEYQTLVSTGFETTDPAYTFDLSSTNPWAASTTNPISGLRSFVSGASASAGQNYFSTDLKRTYYAGMTSMWRFQINHFGNEPDNTTKWQVILSSDQKDLTSASLNGYAVGVNPLTPIAADLVTLWKISNGAYIPIYTSSVDWSNSNAAAGFEVTRDDNGLWTLKYDSNGGFDALVTLGSGTDETYSYASNYGVRYYYASGNGQKLAIDDMSFIQKGCRETIYSVASGNSTSSVWSNTTNGTSVTKNIGRLTSVVVQTTHNITLDEPMVTNHLTVSGGGTLTCNSQDVVPHGNLDVIGSMAALSNSIIFKGNAAQSFTYPSNFNVNNITLYNSLPVNTGSALTLGANLNMRGVLSAELGKINVNNNLTLISNATVTGSIGEIKSAADVVGTITAQRYLPAALQNFVNLGSPITGLTLGDWNDDLVTTGFPGSDYPTYNFNSIYTYNEVLPGDRNTGWVGATSISNPLLTSKGYMVYMTGAANTLDATGAFQKGNVSVPLSLTNTNSEGDGWNLMLNPYPSEVDWNQVVANSNGITSYYVYDSQTGAYKSYNGATGTGNASRYIPMGQSFFVGATIQGSSLNYTEAMKTATNAMLERSYVRPNGFVFELARGQFKEELMLLTSPEATADFEDSHDAYRLVGPVAEMHSLYSKSNDNEKLAVDVRQSWGENNIPLYVNAPTKGKYTLTVSALPMSSDITCWIIKDLVTGVELPLEVGMKIPTSFEGNYEGVRWIIEPKSLVSFGSLQADNFTTDNGSIDVVSTNDSWNYTLVNELGTTVSSSASSSSYTGLAAGRYTVAFSSSTGCAAQQVEVVVGSGNLVSAEAIVAAQEAANESSSIVTDELNPIQLGTMSGAWMIQWKDNYEGKVVMTVYNSVGQIVMTESLDGSTRSHIIPNGKFSEGAYVVALSQDDKQLFSGSCLVIE